MVDLIFVIQISLVSFFIYTLLNVWGFYNFWDSRKPKIFGRPCEFCKMFWVVLIMVFVCVWHASQFDTDFPMTLFSAAGLTYFFVKS